MSSVPPRPESGARPVSFVAAALWTLLVVFLYALFVGMTDGGRQGYLDLVSRTACMALAYSIVLFGVLRLHEPETSIRHVLALRPTPVLVIVLALAVGAGLSLPTEWLDQALVARFPRPPEDKEVYDELYSLGTVGKRVALVVTLVVVQPVLDELFFRGVLFTTLRRSHRAETVVVATAAFETLRSFSPRAMASLFVATLVFAWIRGAVGTVVAPIVARVAFYGVVLVPFAFGHEPKPTGPLLLGSAAVGLVGFAGLLIVSRRSARVTEARLADGQDV